MSLLKVFGAPKLEASFVNVNRRFARQLTDALILKLRSTSIEVALLVKSGRASGKGRDDQYA